MEMTEAEIRNSYKYAANAKKQIMILAQLNDCSRERIELILFGKTNMTMQIKSANNMIIDVKALADEFISGKSLKKLAAKYKIPISTVIRLLEYANVNSKERNRTRKER